MKATHPRPKQGQWLVFTDLDGTLLDHHTYDFSPALPALARLKAASIPVIPVSSKTLAELDVHLSEMGLDGPVVAENGAVIRLPGEPEILTPPGYPRIVEILDELRKGYGFRFTDFADMQVAQVVESTGLKPDGARLAMQRQASEPLLWQDSDIALNDFRRHIETCGLRLLQGGRFLHVLGDIDKGRAIRQLASRLNPGNQVELHSIGLGDSKNDVAMLCQVDIPVIIRKHDGSYLALPERQDAIHTEQPGPIGWNQAINDLLDNTIGGVDG